MTTCYATKRSQRRGRDRALVSYWSDQRVIPTKVNGKTTYVIISEGSSTDEHDGRCKRPGELFPPVTPRNKPWPSCLPRCAVDGRSAVNTVAYSGRADVQSTEDEGHCMDCSSHASDDGSSMMNLTKSYGQLIVNEDKLSATPDNGEACSSDDGCSLHNASCSHRRSALEAQQHLTCDKHHLKVSTDLHSSMVIL